MIKTEKTLKLWFIIKQRRKTYLDLLGLFINSWHDYVEHFGKLKGPSVRQSFIFFTEYSPIRGFVYHL